MSTSCVPTKLFAALATGLVLLSVISRINAKCGGKTTLKALNGTISDGSGKYPANTRCEWLIEAPSLNMSITLVFSEFATECSFDYLFIYDGSSYMSPLIGSFSGDTVQEKVVASSGKMLIYLYSDTNYVLNGFEANYTIENCPEECSGHGTCSNGQCICDGLWRGKSCNLPWCPDNCNTASSNGNCDTVNHHCVCKPGFAGESCSLSLNTNDGANSWYKMVTYSLQFTPHLGHAAVYYKHSDTIWSFGGYDLNSADDSLLKYNLTTAQWIKVSTQQPRPVSRHSHTASLYHDSMLIFGGQHDDQHLSNELWMLNLTTLIWTQLSENDPNAPPPVTEHTANIVDDKLYVYGGRTSNESFSSAMYMYNLKKANAGWIQVKYKSGKDLAYRVMGHSTVYHEDTRSLIVFGGFSPNSAKESIRMNKIHAFHIDDLVWTEWVLTGDPNIPSGRSFHSASLVADYIVIFGGNRHQHNSDETCYDNNLHFFNLKCRKWVPGSVFNIQSPVPLESTKSQRGRFSHVGLVRDSALIIFGGYSGVPLGDMYAYKFPIAVAVVNTTGTAVAGSHCSGYLTSGTCIQDPSCGWCLNQTKCFPIQNSSKCPSGWKTDSCPGSCGVLRQCTSCLTWGIKHPPKCGWCVQDSRCYPQASPMNACEQPTARNADKIQGWWGSNGLFLTESVDECRFSDYPPGLLAISYNATPDSTHPDDVTIVSLTKDNIVYHQGDYLKIVKKDFVGFFYPFKYMSAPWSTFLLQVKTIHVKTSTNTLYLSTDDKINNKEEVARCGIINSGATSCYSKAFRPAGKVLFPNPGKDKKYYMKMEAADAINVIYSTPAWFETLWNGSTNPEYNLPISGRYLQPYTSGGNNCATLTNCLYCMTDASCGWCKLTNKCVSRAASSAVCQNAIGHVQHLVLNATDCFRCSEYVDCVSCAQQILCEWMPGKNNCFRRGRFIVAYIRNPASCNLPCHSRTSCSTCLADKMGCAWCEKTSSCFLFGSYTTRYPYGQCTYWRNSNVSDNCTNCGMHATCKTCLAGIECGWCASTDNPLKGSCFGGDFKGPHKGQCSSLVNISGSIGWSYSKCPDVDECRLGLDDCHHNATCYNVYDSYNCVCNRGFTGDGKTACNKTCYNPCIHGTCGPDYTCHCDLGWLGENCTIDCGCNGHSSCYKGIGICDKCQDYTHGNHCELCVRGSYGNATSPKGCKKCDCNGHGDVTQGECDLTTGVCFCTDNTLGEHCNQCLPGLKGDPRNGGRCYYECSGRSVLTNVTQGDISTFVGKGVTNRNKASCLWVISTSRNTSHNIIYESQPVRYKSSITLQFTNLSLDCLTDHVEIYDGLPSFILGSPSPHPPLFYKLGTFCGSKESQPQIITATLGNMVVLFQGNIAEGQLSTGFGAVFSVHRCTDRCDGNRQCAMTSVGESCVCRNGWIGPDCTVRVCPNNCSFALGQGVCSTANAQCECTAGFTGLDCSTVVRPGKGSWETLFTNPFPNRTYSDEGRVAHTMVLHSNCLLVYGGYSLAMGILNDVMKYDVIGKAWTHVSTNQLSLHMPSARYFHCAVIYQDTMVIHGGLTKSGTSNDSWYFNVVSPEWTEIKTSGPAPKVAGHTCTLVGDIMTLVGGYDPNVGFNSRVYQYSITSKTWTILEPLGVPPTGLYGHSTVYHSSSQSLFVFGGYRLNIQEVQPSSELYYLHLPSRTWNILQPLPTNQPSPKFFHAATVLDDVMVIYGGRSTTNNQFSSELFVYRIRCNSWLSFNAPHSNILGVSPGGLIGASACANRSNMYLFGGFDSHTRSSLYRLTLPLDMCAGMREKVACTSSPGCNWCELHYANHSLNESRVENSTACYSVTSALPAVCHVTSNFTHTVFSNGTLCDITAAKQRACETYSSCASCLSTYPGASADQLQCKWCMSCSGSGKCVEKAVPCDNTVSCGVPQNERRSLCSCPETTCREATCSDCVRDSSCMWTAQLKWLRETKQHLSFNSVAYPWTCFNTSLKSIHSGIVNAVQSTPDCPKPCTQFTNCKSCLDATGGDGGWKECVWSETLGQCFSPSYLPIAEMTGAAGRIVQGSSQQCMASCAVTDQCSTCFQNYNCGWCSDKNSNGHGMCMEGGLKGPLNGTCQGNSIANGQQHISTRESPVWAFSLCPLENECLNNRHNCTVYQNCIDTEESFMCVCKTGYELIGGNCIPVCDDGCLHGQCVSPNNCSCYFGWTSTNCSIKCLCNEHGHCLNETSLDTCVDCRNHTTGKSCEFCLPLYVGNASNNGSCTSCYEVCNKSADVCMDKKELIKAHNMSYSLDPKEVPKWLAHGPEVIDEDGECLCKGKSRGVRCKHCIAGNFFENSRCSPCKCNGHGDVCSEEGRCTCQNNTIQDCSSSKPCYNTQCVKCKDSKFLGNPRESRQCYFKIIHMQEFMISGTPGLDLNENSVSSSPLPKGATVSYVIYPRYTNVDIRTTIDVFQGGIDVFVSTSDRTFVVNVNKTTWTHSVIVTDERRVRRDVAYASDSPNINQVNAGEDKLNTFVDLHSTTDIVHVRDVKNRLVLTFPYQKHSLSNSRFYMIFLGVGDSSHSGTTGIVYFRQDLSQIDLFVFFSVFFSVFFLVLSLCVVAWKIKQFHDRRRIAQVQERELVTMASRPFATYSFLTDMKSAPRSCWKIKRESSKRSLRERKSHLYFKEASNRPVISPVALQTTGDSKAAIASVMFQLPSNENSDFQLAFGSAITTTSNQHSLGVFFGHQLLNAHKLSTRHTFTVTS